MSMKFVILDAANTPASTIAALGIVTLALGIVCWPLRSRDPEAPIGEVLRRDTADC